MGIFVSIAQITYEINLEALICEMLSQIFYDQSLKDVTCSIQIEASFSEANKLSFQGGNSSQALYTVT